MPYLLLLSRVTNLTSKVATTINNKDDTCSRKKNTTFRFNFCIKNICSGIKIKFVLSLYVMIFQLQFNTVYFFHKQRFFRLYTSCMNFLSFHNGCFWHCSIFWNSFKGWKGHYLHIQKWWPIQIFGSKLQKLQVQKKIDSANPSSIQ